MSRRIVLRGFTYTVLLVGLIFLQLGAGRVSARSSSSLHTLLEMIACTLALITGCIALLRYYSNKNYLFLFLGTGFLGTGFLDGYHAIVTSSVLLAAFPSPPQSLIPAGWFVSRVYLALMLLCCWWNTRPGNHDTVPQPIHDWPVYLISGVVFGIVVVVIALVPMPNTFYQNRVIGRPQELIVALLFFVTLFALIYRGHWQKDYFDHWLILSLIFGFATQALFMSFSRKLHDWMFDLAHLCKILSYGCVLIGLFINMFRQFKYAERRQQEMQESHAQLQIIHDELSAATREKELEQRRFQLTVRGSNVGVWEWDLKNDDFTCSPLCYELLGQSLENPVRQVTDFLERVQPRQQTIWTPEAIHPPRSKYQLEVQLKHESQGYRWFGVRGALELNENGEPIRMAGSLQDVTEQKQALQHASLHASIGIGSAIHQSVRGLLQFCVEQILAQLKLEQAFFWSVNKERERLTLEAGPGMIEDPDSSKKRRLSFNSSLGWITSAGKVFVADNIQKETKVPDREWALSQGFKSFAAFPLVVGAQNIGMLTVYSRWPWESHLIELFESLSSGIAVALQRIQNEKQLKASERRFRELAENLDGVLWIHRYKDRQLLYVSPKWKMLTGQMESKHKYPRNWFAFIVEGDREKVRLALDEHLPDGTFDVKYRMYSPDGPPRWVWDRAFLIYNDEGVPSRIGRITQDIHETMQSQQSLEQAQRELQRSNRNLDEFAYDVSHDLQQPLRGIKKLSEWLTSDLGDELPETSARHLQQLQQRVMRLEKMLDDLLEFSRAGRIHETADEVDTRVIVENIIELLDCPETFQIEIVGEMPKIVTERVPLEQIFRNLIGNALKHHDREDGRIEISAKHISDRVVEFCVSDDGPGIAPENHERVFRVLQTLQPRDRVEGSGLGLAIVKRIIESYGGRIELKSALGEGATFCFTWQEL